MPDTTVEVVVQIAGVDVLAGRLWAHHRRGIESQTFAYDPSYVARPDAYALDPMLPLDAGQHQTPAGVAIFGAFSDAAPDRWGRRLATRAERERMLTVADAFRLSDADAASVLGTVAAATRTWRTVAHDVGLTSSEISAMSGAFEHSQADRARDVFGA